MKNSQDVLLVAQEIAENLSNKFSHFIEDAYDINMKLIWVEGGEFMMGCTSEQEPCQEDEKNVHRVKLDGFYIGMLEVTQSQWEKVMGSTYCQQCQKYNKELRSQGLKEKWLENCDHVGANLPMLFVTWEEAMEFCRVLSQKTGKTYSLPTEAQWEYAARGGRKNEGTKYAGSNSIDNVAWYKGNSGDTHPCGTKRANALGIYDMSGNVDEWCKDWYSSSYTSYDTNNPTGPSSGPGRVIRGGSCRVADRSYCSRGCNGSLGFRVVCIP